MKLIGFAQIYNEGITGNLIRCLDSMSRYCDDIVIYDDGSTDDSVSIAEHYKCKIIKGPGNDFSNELFHKQQLLEFALELKPDWLFWLDADEVVEEEGENGGIRKLCEVTTVDSVAFHEVNLWRHTNYYRLDNSYNDGLFCRLWRNNGNLRMNTVKGLHHRQSPLGLTSEITSDLQILHYGFASNESIIRKYTTYKAHGQTGWALNRLIDERTLQLKASNPSWFNYELPKVNFDDIYRVPVASLL